MRKYLALLLCIPLLTACHNPRLASAALRGFSRGINPSAYHARERENYNKQQLRYQLRQTLAAEALARYLKFGY